ncbi:hypothetical protein DXG03_008599 [Asterophora parasitica]|uniref:Deacetylase sirtuin-type domain-containing protein n=1 Tax=Asterophora parasitica TaxID=117018 RepID=A0A9P7KE09_9AGAR|nr:hypothetical protein DXG03_008599 [Asterophora parasitica]
MQHTTALFCQMIAQLWGLSRDAQPTAFHNLLRALDDRGKLLRVYTQNIDAIEKKCGLSFGVPDFEDKRCKSRSKATTTPVERVDLFKESTPSDSNKLLLPPGDPPRCIPLHGTLQLVHCQICNCSYPLEEHLPLLSSGLPPDCPECTSMEETRELIGKRARGIGKLRPSVVLYNEAHKDGEGVGDVVQKDLIGSSKGKGRGGADLLLVVGTSLRVPGTKRMVREFAKAVRSRGSAPSSPSPSSSPRRSPAEDEEPAIKAIYLNLDFPVPTREWEGVFDAWIQGDAQGFAEMLHEEIEMEARAKELAIERKRKRDDEDAPLFDKKETSLKTTPKQTKGKAQSSSSHSAKRRKVTLPPTPPKTPATNSASPKLFLRIPARPRPHQLTPELYVTATPPTSGSSHSSFHQGQAPITPEKSPPARINKATKAGRRAARAASAARTAAKTALLPAPIHVDAQGYDSPLSALYDDEEDDDENAHLLPDSFVRTVQYGLRGAGE